MPNVTVLPPSTVKVQVGTSNNPRVPSISYVGNNGTNLLRALADVAIPDLQDGYGIIYSAAIDRFVVQSLSHIHIDGGEY